MKVSDLIQILNAKVVAGHDYLDREITHAFASDLMSDVLTINRNNLVLLTGLTNIQTIRTSEMAEVSNIILVRNKTANEEMIRLAAENNIVMLECKFSMFRACGLLFQAGLKPVY